MRKFAGLAAVLAGLAGGFAVYHRAVTDGPAWLLPWAVVAVAVAGIVAYGVVLGVLRVSTAVSRAFARGWRTEPTR